VAELGNKVRPNPSSYASHRGHSQQRLPTPPKARLRMYDPQSLHFAFAIMEKVNTECAPLKVYIPH